MPREINSVGVVGGGLMGAGIAEVSAVAGMPVVVRDLPQFLDAARERVEKSLAGAVKRGKIDQAKRDEVLARNTSSIPIAELAGKVQHPGRVVGVHFFSPVPVMKLVEIVVALDTDPETADIAFAFANKLGKHPIRTKDRSGFIVNFLLTGYIMAAIRMYEEGFASREDIDDGMRLGAGHPMGPLTLADMTGLDIVYSVGNSMYEEFKREEYAPPPLLKRMIAVGRLGRKSGRGFYEYDM